MTIKDALLAVISAEDNGIKGRTLLQKKLYFLSVISGEDFGFAAHYYGPYSSDVAEQMEALVEARLLTEEAETFPETFNPSGDFRRYNYSLASAGREFLAERWTELKQYEGIFERINSHPLASDSKLLSTAAKVFFIVAKENGASVKIIQRHARSLGWDVSDRNVQEVVEYLKHLDLISAT